MAGNSVKTPLPDNYLRAAFPDMFPPRIDAALAMPYKDIENPRMTFRKVMALMGNESKTYLNTGNATDSMDRVIISYLISAHTTPGPNAASVLTIDPSSLGPNPAGYAPDQRHEFQINDRVYINNGGLRLQGKVTAVTTNTVTVLGEETGSDWGAAVVNGVTQLFNGSNAWPEGSTSTRYGFTVGTTREDFNLQTIRHSWSYTGTLEASGATTWYGASGNVVTPGEGIYWTNETTNIQHDQMERKVDLAHLIENPNIQNATGELQMTGLWWATDNNGGAQTSIVGGWNNLVLQDFDDYFALYIDLNIGVKRWMGMIDSASSHTIDATLADWGMANHLFSMGSLNQQDMEINFGFKGYGHKSTGYGIQWTAFEEFDNSQSAVSISRASMYLMPVGTVPTSAGPRPYVETLFLGSANGNDRKLKFNRILGVSNNGEVATINDSNTYNFITERGNLLRLMAGLGRIDGQ